MTILVFAIAILVLRSWTYPQVSLVWSDFRDRRMPEACPHGRTKPCRDLEHIPAVEVKLISQPWRKQTMTSRSVAKHFLTPCGVLAACSLAVLAQPVAARGDGVRVVKYSREEIVPVRAKLRFSTLIVLPDNEEILDYTTGDKEFWIINGAHNLCYVHPAQAGIRSNLNLITTSGTVYSFLLTEISGEPKAEPDLKLFVEPRESSGTTNLVGYVRAGEAEAYRKEIERLRAQSDEHLQTARAQAAEEVNRFRSAYAAKLRFDYSTDSKPDHQPFLVSAIYHDELFTYIRCDAREKPTLYEVKDGKPNLINFQLEGNVYIAPKLIDSGYLVIGKKKLIFKRHTK